MPNPVEDTVSDTVAANEEETDVEAHGIVSPVEDTVDTVAASDEEPDVEAHSWRRK